MTNGEEINCLLRLGNFNWQAENILSHSEWQQAKLLVGLAKSILGPSKEVQTNWAQITSWLN